MWTPGSCASGGGGGGPFLAGPGPGEWCCCSRSGEGGRLRLGAPGLASLYRHFSELAGLTPVGSHTGGTLPRTREDVACGRERGGQVRGRDRAAWAPRPPKGGFRSQVQGLETCSRRCAACPAGFPWGRGGGVAPVCGVCSEKPGAVRGAVPTSLVGEAQGPVCDWLEGVNVTILRMPCLGCDSSRGHKWHWGPAEAPGQALEGGGVCWGRRPLAEPTAACSLRPSLMAPLPSPHSILGFFPRPPGKAAPGL